MSNQRLKKAREKTGDGYAKTNAIVRGAGFDRDRDHYGRRSVEQCIGTPVGDAAHPENGDHREKP